MACLHGVLMHGAGFGKFDENAVKKRELSLEVQPTNSYSVFS